jgi:acetyl-CoA synthetase
MADPDLPRWTSVADRLTWSRHPDVIYQPQGRYGSWFPGGSLNVVTNCVDRHLPANADRPAIHWEGEPGDRRTLTYHDLAREVETMAAALRGLGVGTFDRVALHLGWLPEAVIAMLACARIGAVFAVLPVPLPVEALAERLDDLAPRILITQDGAWRHGAIIPTKARVDDALTAVAGVEHTIVIRRTGLDVAWYEGDRWLHHLLDPFRDIVGAARPADRAEPPSGIQGAAPAAAVPPAALPADHPLLITWLANRRGRPVTAVHGTANLLASALAVHRYGLSPGGVFWCAGDPAWIAAPVHGVLGPLAWGDTTVMFEGTLDVPTRRRLWDIIDRYRVATLLTAPSVLARVRGWPDATPPDPDQRTLRRVIAMAEPFHPGLRAWIAEQFTGDPDAVADAWGQIELGGIVTVDRPVDPERMPDTAPEVTDPAGHSVPDGTPGELVLRRPWAGTLRALGGAGADDAYAHWSRPDRLYSTGDRVVRRPGPTHPDNQMEFLGRIDPVVSISGQLVSLTEVRDVLLDHPFLAAAEVVTRPDVKLGRRLVAYVVPASDTTPGTALAHELVEAIQETLGGLARPSAIVFLDRIGDDLPPAVRRRALEIVAASLATPTPAQITWAQVRAAAAIKPAH